MAMDRFSVPNWAQQVLADAAGLQGREIAVRQEDDNKIVLLDHKTRNEYLINKKDGSVIKTEPQRIKDIKKSDAPTVQSQGTAC